MGGVVLTHHAGDVGERDPADAFLRPRPLPRLRGQGPEEGEVGGPGGGEGREAFFERTAPVVALGGDAGSVEVGQVRLGFLPDPAEALAVALPLEVGQVPDLLDQAEAPARRRLPPPGFPQRDRRPAELVGHRFEPGQQVFAFCRLVFHRSSAAGGPPPRSRTPL
jgi:hypothetical protein